MCIEAECVLNHSTLLRPSAHASWLTLCSSSAVFVTNLWSHLTVMRLTGMKCHQYCQPRWNNAWTCCDSVYCVCDSDPDDTVKSSVDRQKTYNPSQYRDDTVSPHITRLLWRHIDGGFGNQLCKCLRREWASVHCDCWCLHDCWHDSWQSVKLTWVTSQWLDQITTVVWQN